MKNNEDTQYLEYVWAEGEAWHEMGGLDLKNLIPYIRPSNNNSSDIFVLY